MSGLSTMFGTWGNAHAGSASPPALEVPPREAFRMWQADWQREEPARPPVAVTTHGIHMPDLDRLLWEHIVLPAALEARVPLEGGDVGHVDAVVKVDSPVHGLWWPFTENEPASAMSSRCFLVFTSERQDVVEVWLNAATREVDLRSHVPGVASVAFETLTLGQYAAANGTGHHAPNARVVIMVRPEDCNAHNPLRAVLAGLRQHLHSFYVRVPVLEDRMRFLRHLVAHTGQHHSRLQHCLAANTADMPLLSNARLRRIAERTRYFHYSDLARVLLRALGDWQRDVICHGRAHAVSLDDRLSVIFCVKERQGAQQQACVRKRVDDTLALDPYFLLPPTRDAGDTANVVQTRRAELVASIRRQRETAPPPAAGPELQDRQRPAKRQRVAYADASPPLPDATRPAAPKTPYALTFGHSAQ